MSVQFHSSFIHVRGCHSPRVNLVFSGNYIQVIQISIFFCKHGEVGKIIKSINEHVVLLFFLDEIPWKFNKSWNCSCLFNHHKNVCQVKRLCSHCHELSALAEILWNLHNLWCLRFSKQYSEQINIYIPTRKKKMAEAFLWYLFCLLHLFQLNTKKGTMLRGGNGM